MCLGKSGQCTDFSSSLGKDFAVVTSVLQRVGQTHPTNRFEEHYREFKVPIAVRSKFPNPPKSMTKFLPILSLVLFLPVPSQAKIGENKADFEARYTQVTDWKPEPGTPAVLADGAMYKDSQR